MNDTMFKLINTYESILSMGDVDRPIRLEIFRSIDDKNIYRARVWMQNTYNLYPTFVNTDENGNDLHNTHSSDQIDMEITTLIAENPEFVTGKRYVSEEEFIGYIKSRIAYYQNLVGKKE